MQSIIKNEPIQENKLFNFPILTKGELIIEVKDNSSLVENNVQPISIFNVIDCEIESALYNLGITASQYNDNNDLHSGYDLQSVYDDRITEINEKDEINEKEDINKELNVNNTPKSFKDLIITRHLELSN